MRLPQVFLLLTALAVAGRESTAASASTAANGCALAVPRDLRVQLINDAAAAPLTLATAEAEAATIWAGAGLRLTWTFPSAPLDLRSRGTVEVIVRRTLSRPPGADAGDLPSASSPPLGAIAFGEDGRPGNLIEVSFDALTSLVMRGSQLDRHIEGLPNRAQSLLLGRGLGRVVAHELGHWLMGRGHAEEGLMRASFGVRDLLDRHAARLPRRWTAPGSDLKLAMASSCGLDVPR